MREILKDKKKIIAWLDSHEIENYTLVLDDKYNYVVDVEGNVYLSDKELTKIPINFGKVNGDFFCYSNKLTSLEGSPTLVCGGFYCGHNQLTSLLGSPTSVGGYFYCQSNHLTTMDFLPNKVGEQFICKDNPDLGKYQECESLAEILVEKERRLLNTKFERLLQLVFIKFKM